MILRLAGFGPFSSAFLPAAGLWTSFAGVTIVAGGGRSGSTDDNCAAFSTSLGSVLSLTVSPGAVSGVYTATYGLAVRVLTITDFFTVASIWSANSRFDLQILSTGAVRVTQTTGFVPLGTVCETVAGVVPIGDGGCYLEVQIQFVSGLASAVQIRGSDQFGDMNPLVQGALLQADAGPFTTFRLGGGVGESPATWRVADVYLNDGVPAATAIAYKGRLIYNDSYFGNTHVEAFYPTADGTNLSTGNTPWVPDTGAVEYTQIDEHPPDEDTSYVAAEDSDQTSTFAFQSPRTRPFGRLNCAASAPIYGLQWDGRLRNTGEEGDVAAIIRRLVTGTLAGDVVEASPTLSVTNEDYRYYPTVFDRDPTDDDAPWTFDVFFPSAVGAVDTTEIGMRLL